MIISSKKEGSRNKYQYVLQEPSSVFPLLCASEKKMLQVAPRSLKFLQFHLFLDDSKKRDWLGTDIKRITFWERLNCYYSFRIKIQTARTPITIFITIISIKASSMYLVFHNIKYSCLLNGLLRRIYTLKFFFSTVLHFFRVYYFSITISGEWCSELRLIWLLHLNGIIIYFKYWGFRNSATSIYPRMTKHLWVNLQQKDL